MWNDMVHTLYSQRKSVPDCWLTEIRLLKSQQEQLFRSLEYPPSPLCSSLTRLLDDLHVLEIVPERITKLKIKGQGFSYQTG